MLLTLPSAWSAVLNSLKMPPTSDLSADRFINLPNLRCTLCIVADEKRESQDKKEHEQRANNQVEGFREWLVLRQRVLQAGPRLRAGRTWEAGGRHCSLVIPCIMPYFCLDYAVPSGPSRLIYLSVVCL